MNPGLNFVKFCPYWMPLEFNDVGTHGDYDRANDEWEIGSEN